MIATRNRGKREEVRRILEPGGIRLLGLEDFPDLREIEETGETFLENALAKAQAVARGTGLLAFADDSGIEVDALGGAPGVRSARYAGEPRSDARNNEKLLAALAGVASASRGARFHCVAVAAFVDGKSVWAEGTWRGILLEAPRGASGFGYDPLFLDPETGRTAAQMAPEEKDARSHRGKAFRALLARISERIAAGRRAC